MYDLHVPETLYEKEIKKLKDAPAKLIENRDLNSSKRKKETDRLHALRERLQVGKQSRSAASDEGHIWMFRTKKRGTRNTWRE